MRFYANLGGFTLMIFMFTVCFSKDKLCWANHFTPSQAAAADYESSGVEWKVTSKEVATGWEHRNFEYNSPPWQGGERYGKFWPAAFGNNLAMGVKTKQTRLLGGYDRYHFNWFAVTNSSSLPEGWLPCSGLPIKSGPWQGVRITLFDLL